MTIESDFSLSGEGPTADRDADLCCRIGQSLGVQYPGHFWAVQVNHEAGWAAIRLCYTGKLQLPSQYGYGLHISDLHGNNLDKEVMRAGGELLERYGLPRCGADKDTLERAIEHGYDHDAALYERAK